MKKNYTFKSNPYVMLLFCIVLQSGIVVGQTTETIAVSADTYVRDGAQADDNYGAEIEILARDTTTSAPRIVFLKFPVGASLPSSITSATLKFFSRINSSSTSTETLEVHKLGSNWGESTVTWNNKPATGAFITDNLPVPVGPTNPAPYTEISQDVTSYFNEVLASSDTEISFAIKALPSDAGGDGRAVRIGTKEDPAPTGASIDIEYTLSLDDFNSDGGTPLKVFPNPANSTFSLNKIFKSSETVGISIHNMLGKEVLAITERVYPGTWKKTFNKTELNLHRGIYLITVSSDLSGNSSSKIVIY